MAVLGGLRWIEIDEVISGKKEQVMKKNGSQNFPKLILIGDFGPKFLKQLGGVEKRFQNSC